MKVAPKTEKQNSIGYQTLGLIITIWRYRGGERGLLKSGEFGSLFS